MPLRDTLRAHRFTLGLCAVFLLPWLAFGRSLTQDFAAIDDGFLIVENPIVHRMDATHLKLAFTTFDPELYIPATIVSFQANWWMGNGSPLPFHATNIVLHGINAVLVGLLLLGWTKNRSIALISAAVFAVHPLHTEAVVWAAGRKDLLCTMFFLLSYLSFRQSLERHRIAWLSLSMLAFVLALLSKVLAVTLPVIFLLDVLLLQKKQSMRLVTLALVPFIVLSAAFLFIATFGKGQILASESFWNVIVMAQKSVGFYIGKLLLPVGLSVLYPFEGTISLLKPEFFVPTLLNSSLLAVAWWGRKKRPLLTFAILFFFVTLLPTFFNFHKGGLLFFAVDRYAYIASIGFFLAVCSLGSKLVIALRIDPKIIHSAAAIIVTILAAISVHQSGFWNSPDALFGRSIALYPASPAPRMAFASVLRERNQLSEAFAILHEGARTSDHPGLNVEAGLIYAAAGQVSDAREQFAMALRKDLTLATAMYYLGFLDEHDGDETGAIGWYRKAIVSDPSYVTVHVHLARLLMTQKTSESLQEAKDQLLQAMHWNPVSVETMQALIDLETVRGNPAEVEQWKTRLQELQ